MVARILVEYHLVDYDRPDTIAVRFRAQPFSLLPFFLGFYFYFIPISVAICSLGGYFLTLRGM